MLGSPTATAHVFIQHTYRQDLIVEIGIGNTSSPTRYQRIWNGEGGSADDLDLTVDLTAATAYLPPSTANKWFLRVFDGGNRDIGKIVTFTITYTGTTYNATDVPVPISDFKWSFAHIPSVAGPSAHA